MSIQIACRQSVVKTGRSVADLSSDSNSSRVEGGWRGEMEGGGGEGGSNDSVLDMARAVRGE